MANLKIKPWLIVFEVTGFLLVFLVIWLDETIDLPYLLLGASPTPLRLSEALLESICILIICGGVVGSTLWLFKQIERLESYIVMCAWCRKVKVDERWITIEAYLQEKNNLQTTHGLCPSCAEEQLKTLRK
jgi:hypothetical protein